MFFCVEERTKESDFSMALPHSHEHYELYFLLEGKRSFFTEDKMFVIEKGTLVVVPPFRMHKTEGGPYRRLNINFSEDFLTPEEKRLLSELSEAGATRFDGTYGTVTHALLSELASVQTRELRRRMETEVNLMHTLLYFIGREKIKPLSPAGMSRQTGESDPLVLKITYFLNTNFAKEVTLGKLEGEFYLSKATLCARFRKKMGCSIMEYLTLVRLSHAKSLLTSSDMTVEQIAAECGFSSANYLGLVFRKEIGVSPLGYRKRVR